MTRKQKHTIVVIFSFLLLERCDLWSQDQGEFSAVRQTIASQVRLANAISGKSRINKLNELCNDLCALQYQLQYQWGFDLSDSIKKYSSAALTESMAQGYYFGEGMALLNLANNAIFSFKPDKKTASENINRAIRLGEDHQDHSLIGEAYLQKMLLYWPTRQRSEFLDKSLHHFRLAKNNRGIAIAGDYKVGELCDLYQYDKALQFCEESLHAARNWGPAHKLQQFTYIKELLGMMSKIHEAAGDYASAIHYMQHSRRYGKGVNYEVTVFTQLAELYMRLGKMDSAYYYINNYLNHYPSEPTANSVLADILLEDKQPEKAFDILSRIRDTLEKEEYPRIFILMAKAYHQLANDNAALRYLRRWKPDGLSGYDNRRDLLDKEKLLCSIYTRQGKYENAFQARKRYISLLDSTRNNQFVWRINNKLFTQRRSIELKEQEARIQLLQKDNILQSELLRTAILLKQQQEEDLILVDRDNDLKHLQLGYQNLLKNQKQVQLGILDRENKLLDKNNQLKDQALSKAATTRRILYGGMFTLSLTGLFVIRNLRLKRKNDKLVGEKANDQLKMDRLIMEKERAEMEEKAAELEVKALRAQMNPHFIFNCLSSINIYILRNQGKSASKYLEQFSRLIKQVLETSQKPLTSLKEELTMLKLYVAMEKLRCNDSFEFNIEIDKDLDPVNVLIPPLVLQPFCENAIWHGLMPKNENGLLTVSCSKDDQHLICIIRDNGIGRKMAAELSISGKKEHESMGLKITGSRVALFNNDRNSPDAIRVKDLVDNKGEISGTEVTVKFAWKEEKITSYTNGCP